MLLWTEVPHGDVMDVDLDGPPSASRDSVSLNAAESSNSIEKEAELVLALQAEPPSFMPIELLPHELNAVDSQGEAFAENVDSSLASLLPAEGDGSGPSSSVQPSPGVQQMPSNENTNVAIVPAQGPVNNQPFAGEPSTEVHQDPVNENINVGMALLPDSIDSDPGLEAFMATNGISIGTDAAWIKAERIMLWAKHFSPLNNSDGITVPQGWCDFITLTSQRNSRY
jgi:hypothetical protein